MIIKHKVSKFLVTVFITFLVTSTVSAGPKKKPSKTRSEEAIQAEFFFWEVFHNGLYDLIPDVLNALTAAYLTNPNDSTTAAYIGAAHAWRLSERARTDPIPATITDHAVLARKYFEEKVRMDPHDAHYIGFLGSLMMSEADVHGDAKLMDEGYKTLLKSTKLYPEFNYVTAGLTLTGGIVESLPSANSKIFKTALEWQWKAMELCLGARINRANPDASPYMDRFTTEGPKKVCWNTELAPHKFEGFYLNMGDMLVKSGDWRTAQKIYANARLSPNYATWQFAPILEQRIAEAQSNVALFNTPPGPSGQFVKPMMAQSAFACTGCHQN